MTKPIAIQRGYDLSLYLLAFSLPLFYVMQNVSIIMLALFWVLKGDYRRLIPYMKSHSLGLLWMAFFALHVVGIFYSSNTVEAIADTSRKVSFFLLPLFICGSQRLSRRTFEIVIASFVIGNLVAFVIDVGVAVSHVSELGSGAFFYHQLARLNDNAVYASWKCLTAIVFLFFLPFRLIAVFKTRSVMVTMVMVLSTFMILLSARTLIALGVTIVGLRIAYELLVSRVHIVSNLVLVSTLGVLFVFLLALNDSPLKKRYEEVIHAVAEVNQTKKLDAAAADNYSKRAIFWHAAWENLNMNYHWILGAGVGDVQDLQNARLTSPNFKHDNFYNIQSFTGIGIHNMYLHAWLGLGIPGLLVLIAIVVMAIQKLYLIGDYTGMWIHVIGSIFCIQESALQLQGGIVFFTFVSCLFINRSELQISRPRGN